MFLSDELELLDVNSEKLARKLLERRFNCKIDLENNIIFKFFPRPHLKIEALKILYDDQVMLRGSDVNFSLPLEYLMMLFSFDKLAHNMFTMSEQLKLQDATLKVDLMKKFLEENFLGKATSNYNLQLQVGMMHLDADFKTVKLSDNSLKVSEGKNISGSGNLTLQKHKLGYSFDVFNTAGTDLNLRLHSPGSSFNIAVTGFDREKVTLQEGEISLNVQDLKYPTKQGEDDAANDLDFKAKIKANDDGSISLSDISFKGEVVEKPDLNLRLYKVSDDLIEAQVFFAASELYLDILEDDVVADDFKITEIVRDVLRLAQTLDGFNVNLQLNLDSINIGKYAIKDLELLAYNIIDRMLVEKLSLKLPYETDVHFSGSIDGNSIRKKLEGEIKLKTNNPYKIIHLQHENNSFAKLEDTMEAQASLFAMQNILKASHVHFQWKEAQGEAEVSLYEVPYNAPIKRFAVKANGISLDEIGFTALLDAHVQKLYDADEDKSGDKYFTLTNADEWLRKPNRTLSLDLDLANVSFRKQNIQKVQAILNTTPNLLHIRLLEFDDPRLDGKMHFKFSLPVLRPQLHLRADFDKLDSQFLASLFPLSGPLEDERKDINFLSANSYDGKFQLKINELLWGEDILARNISSQGQLNLGYISVKDFSCNIWNGNLQLDLGLVVSTSNPIFNLDFNAYNINPQLPFKLLTGADKMQGYMSIAGKLQGNLKRSESSNLYGDADFIGALISWQGFDLNKIIEITDGQYTTDSKMRALDYYSQYGSTMFDSLNGSINVQNGVASINNMKLANKRLSGVYSSNYDLASKAISGAGTFAFIPVGSTIPLTITTQTYGQMPAPQNNSIDYSQVTTFIKAAGKK